MASETILELNPTIALRVLVSEGQPPIKARNGRWVKGQLVHLVFRLDARLPGNVVIEPTNASNLIRFTRHVDEPTAWQVGNRAAHEFQAWVATFGQRAADLVRQEFEKFGVLSLFRAAVSAD
jgi:hypothetical protein